MMKAAVAIRNPIQYLANLSRERKDDRPWQKAMSYGDKLTRKEKHLEYLRIKCAALEAEADLLNDKEVADTIEQAQGLMEYYRTEIDCDESVKHIPLPVSILTIFVLVIAELATWVTLILSCEDSIGALPAFAQLTILFGGLILVASAIDIASMFAYKRIAKCFLEHRIENLKAWMATVTWH